MLLSLALLSLLFYASYKIIKTGHDVKTLQARVLEKYPPTPETSEQITERNLRLELENQEQLQAITGVEILIVKQRTLALKSLVTKAGGQRNQTHLENS